jgi:fatty-acyl-CoA synthase
LIGGRLRGVAARYPEATALVYGAQRLSYAALNERACRVAHGLQALGIRRGSRVAALLHNCNAFVEVFFATAKLGAVFVPLNFRLVSREVGELLDASTPQVLFAGPEFSEVLDPLETRASFPAQTRIVDERYEAWLGAQAADEPDVPVAADDLLMLLHSSGTTGLPKGAMFTHGTALVSSMAKIIDFTLTPRDACVVFGPLFHVGPLMDLALPLLLLGGKVVVGASGQFDAERLLGTIARERATVAPVYPAMLRRVLAVQQLERYDLASWRLLITGGEPVPLRVLRAMYDRFPELGFVNNYGSTEGGPITTFLDPADKLRKIGSVGKPSFGVEVRIVGEDGRALPPQQVGELAVRSAFVCRGYWNRPDLTEASLRNGWWHTGDLGWQDEEGFIWISGRLKDMIKSGTENIYPVEVEQVIAGLEGVAEAAVVGIPDEQWGEALAAFVVRTPGSRLDAASVIEHCRQHLASYKKPRHVVFVDSLPRNTTNKVSKPALRAGFAALGRPSSL